MSLSNPSPFAYQTSGGFDPRELDPLGILDHLDQGVLMTDSRGIMIYYNQTQAKIDDMDPKEVLGRPIFEVYTYNQDSSTCMRVLQHGHPIINYSLSYRSQNANVGNTIHSVFPIKKEDKVVGTICFVKDYNILERTIPSFLKRHKQRILGEGTRYVFSDIIGHDPGFVRAVKMAKMAANSPSPVMLFGETGTGKELFAQAIHNFHSEGKAQFIAVNCAAIPDNLLEGILFGTTKGAFTGALDKPGLFERANGGTLFLDEVHAMPNNLQAKLLRCLQERKVRRVGSLNELDVRVKVISSINQTPQDAMSEGILRTDLFYRLGVVYIRIPPLRERMVDLEELARHFLGRYSRRMAKKLAYVSAEVMDLFWQYHWPGNVRELEHIIEGAVNFAGDNNVLMPAHLPPHFSPLNSINPPELAGFAITAAPGPNGQLIPDDPPAWAAGPRGIPQKPVPASPKQSKTLQEIREDAERRAIEQAIAANEGIISQAAKSLGVSRQLLHQKLKKYTLNFK
jgi:arginine utilization regulatory protein